APVEHIDRDDNISPPRQFRGDALARVRSPLEFRQRWMFVLGFDDFLLAPEVEPTVIVERDDRRGRLRKPLGNEHISRYAQVGRGVEGDFLADVAVDLDALDDLGLWLAGRGDVVQQIEELAPRLLLPRRHVAELRADVR